MSKPRAWGGPSIWFRGARDPRAAPNHLHLDLRPLTTMNEEVDRLVALGATVVERYDDITPCRTPKATSSASSWVPAIPTRHRVADPPSLMPPLQGSRATPSHGLTYWPSGPSFRSG